MLTCWLSELYEKDRTPNCRTAASDCTRTASVWRHSRAPSVEKLTLVARFFMTAASFE